MKFLLKGMSGLVFGMLSSCAVSVETPITADAELDDRLVGVWKPVWRSKDELGNQELPRNMEDFVMNEMIIIGKTDDGFLKCVLIDGFDSGGFGVGAELIGKTRNYKRTNFVVAEIQPPPQPEEPEESGRPAIHFVVEYEFGADGDLFFYGIHDGMFDKEARLPEIEHRVERSGFGEQVAITAMPDALLEWLVDPKVSDQRISLGKYRKMILPSGNSPPITEPKSER